MFSKIMAAPVLESRLLKSIRKIHCLLALNEQSGQSNRDDLILSDSKWDYSCFVESLVFIWRFQFQKSDS